MIFDGKTFAREIEATLRLRLRSDMRVPKIVSILVGDDAASALYTRLKVEAAKRCGIDFEVHRLAGGRDVVAVVSRLATLADGIMVQLPIPGMSRGQQARVLAAVPLDKDVDGLRWELSGIKSAAVRAILSIVERIAKGKKRFAVLGSGGAVGRPLTQFLRQQGNTVTEIEVDTRDPAQLTRAAEVVISCVGKAGLVTGDMVSDRVIAIDVGMSQVAGKVVGDMTQEVYQKASVAVVVPGGVGPVTVASLMANAVGLML